MRHHTDSSGVRCEIDETAPQRNAEVPSAAAICVRRNEPKDSRVVATRPPPTKEALIFLDFTMAWRRCMLKKLMLTTASLVLLTGVAIAQAPDQPKQSPPAATPDQPKQAPS